MNWIDRLRGKKDEPSPSDPAGKPASPSRAPLPAHLRRREEAAAAAPPPDHDRRIALDENLIREIRGRLAQIPPLPLVVQRLVHELASPESSARSVAEIASSDPVLTATLLRAINAAFHGLSREVTDVRQAVTLLGFDTVQALVMQFGLAKMFESGPRGVGYNTEDLWIHSLCVSLVAITLAKRSGGVDLGFVTTLGLLHDIGKLGINSKFPDRVALLLEDRKPGESWLAREERLFGADHAFVGAHLARQWRLPPELIQAIQFHHLPRFAPLDRMEPKVRRALLLVHVANQLVKYGHVYSADVEVDLVSDERLAELGLTAPLDDLFDREVKQSISRGIFFVEEVTPRPLKAVQRMMRTRSVDQMLAMRSIPESTPGMARIRIRPIAGLESAVPGDPARVDLSAAASPDAPGADVLATGRLGEREVERALELLRKAMGERRLPKSVVFSVLHVTKLMLGNALARPSGDRFSIRLQATADEVVLGIECASLGFAKLFDLGASGGADAEAHERRLRAVLACSLGNLLVLGWVDRVEADASGERMLFGRKLAEA